MNNTLKVKLKSRVDTSENWTKINPVLLSGEQGIELTPDGAYYIKIGDGKTEWGSLPYVKTDLATKAVQDANGNDISATYATKKEITNNTGVYVGNVEPDANKYNIWIETD